MTTTENETKVETQGTPKEETMNETVESKKSDVKESTNENNSTPASPTKKTETLKPAITAHKKDFEKDVVYLYQFTRSTTIPSLSACCLKVENWLRMSGIRYEVSYDEMMMITKQLCISLYSYSYRTLITNFVSNPRKVIYHLWN